MESGDHAVPRASVCGLPCIIRYTRLGISLTDAIHRLAIQTQSQSTKPVVYPEFTGGSSEIGTPVQITFGSEFGQKPADVFHIGLVGALGRQPRTVRHAGDINRAVGAYSHVLQIVVPRTAKITAPHQFSALRKSRDESISISCVYRLMNAGCCCEII